MDFLIACNPFSSSLFALFIYNFRFNVIEQNSSTRTNISKEDQHNPTAKAEKRCFHEQPEKCQVQYTADGLV